MRSDPATSTRPAIRYRPGVERPARSRAAPRDNRDDKARFVVAKDWPGAMPVTVGEVAVIEAFLASAVDALLQPLQAPR